MEINEKTKEKSERTKEMNKRTKQLIRKQRKWIRKPKTFLRKQTKSTRKQRKQIDKTKKTNKKTHRKKHLTQKQNIIFQSIPNYSSNQFTGHQNNKSVAFVPPPQQESRTDNLVGDLLSRVITKIENDGNKQTQEYSKDYGVEEQEVETMVDIAPPEDKEGADFFRKDDSQKQ